MEIIITIILMIVIIFILVGIGIFCWNFFESAEPQTEVQTFEEQYVSNYNNNNIGSIGNGTNRDVGVDNNIFNYIDMSKYYLNTSNGNVGNIYNKMLDTLGKQKCIVRMATDSECIKSTIDLNKRCVLDEYDEFYVCRAYTGGMRRRYKYFYFTGKSESNSEDLWWMNSNDDFVMFEIDCEITNEDYKWDYKYNENVSRNGYSCYEIIANWDNSFILHSSGEFRENIGVEKLYIDMNTYKIIEIERTSYYNGIKSSYSIFYEYLDNELEIPKEAQEFLKI